MAGPAQKYRINHKDIQQALNNLNAQVTQQLKPYLQNQPSSSLQPRWIDQGKQVNAKNNIRSDMMNNGKDYQALNNALLQLSKGNLAVANRMLNNIINRMVKTHGDPRLIKRLQDINQATQQQPGAQNQQQLDPNSSLGLLRSIELGLSTLALQQQESMIEGQQLDYINNLQESQREDEEKVEEIEHETEEETEEEREETLEQISEQSEANEKNCMQMEPKPNDTEFFDESKTKEAKGLFESGEGLKEGNEFLKVTKEVVGGTEGAHLSESSTNLPTPSPMN